MKRWTVVVAALVVGVCAQGQESERTISVTGTAVIKVEPDYVTWHIVISELDADLGDAKAQSDAKLGSIVGLLDDLDVAREDFETGALRVHKEYERDERGRELGFVGYAITRVVTVRQRDLARFDEFLEKLLGAAEVEVNYSLESSEIEERRKESRLEATRAAKEKAQAMVEALGARLGAVWSISEHPPGQPMPMRDMRFANT